MEALTPTLTELENFLALEEKSGETIFPAKENWFRALKLTPFEKVSVVILGQDPYHGEDQAHGLAFSVDKKCKLPPSLRNIYKEIETDLEKAAPANGDLSLWAQQGVLLLNTVLTVRKGEAGSHQKKGWETFTKEILKSLSQHKRDLTFILWGAQAKKLATATVDFNKHHIITSPHPSPLSSYRGFFGSKPFTKTNKYLETHGLAPIKWV